jgi:hypothetical protein
VILPVVLYGCETWSVSLREEHKLQVSEKEVLSKIYGSKKDEVSQQFRTLCNEELGDLYRSSSVVGVKWRSLLLYFGVVMPRSWLMWHLDAQRSSILAVQVRVHPSSLRCALSSLR